MSKFATCSQCHDEKCVIVFGIGPLANLCRNCMESKWDKLKSDFDNLEKKISALRELLKPDHQCLYEGCTLDSTEIVWKNGITEMRVCFRHAKHFAARPYAMPAHGGG